MDKKKHPSLRSLPSPRKRIILKRKCSVCIHVQRKQIDKALVASASLRDIAGQYNLSKSALERHKSNHIPRQLRAAQEKKVQSESIDLLADVCKIYERTKSILDKVENNGDYKTALNAIRETRANLELVGKLLGKFDDKPQVNVFLDVQYQQFRSTIINALQAYPDARLAVAEALRGSHASSG